MAPMKLLDHVVAHELVHLEIKKHSPAFWARLGQVLPDCDFRREQLRVIGRRLEKWIVELDGARNKERT
jgi:predicted metal-dependent hydrolase